MITDIYKVYPLPNIKSLGRNDANFTSLNVSVEVGGITLANKYSVGFLHQKLTKEMEKLKEKKEEREIKKTRK